jgi:hypothetical protein
VPESIRSLLHDIADDGSQPSRDLASGAYKRARTITRRRFAIGAVSVVTALALGGAGTAGLLGRDDEALPSPADPTTTQEETTEEETDEGLTCNVSVEDWEGLDFSFQPRGESEAPATLTEIPDETLWRGVDGDVESATLMLSGDESSVIDVGDYLYYPAPDGDRTIGAYKPSGCGDVYMELHDAGAEAAPVFSMDTVACPITWSPDSNKVVFSESAGERSYVLDVSTGELFDLPEELYCTAKWLPDSERLWDNQGNVVAYDGSGTEQVAVIEDDPEEGGYYIGSGVSADLGEACIHETEGDSPGWRCDRYFDLETGEEIDLPVVGGPVDGEVRQVEFLEDGSMLIFNQIGSTEATLYLVGPDGELVDELELPEGMIPFDSQLELLSWSTG